MDTRIHSHYASVYPRIYLVNIFKIIVTAYPCIHFNIIMLSRQHKKHTAYVHVSISKLLKVEKRIKGITTYPGIQLFQGYSFEVVGYSPLTPLFLSLSLCIGGFHVTSSSPPCWWTVNKRLLITSLCLSTSICSFHHCYLCLPRLHENHL